MPVECGYTDDNSPRNTLHFLINKIRLFDVTQTWSGVEEKLVKFLLPFDSNTYLNWSNVDGKRLSSMLSFLASAVSIHYFIFDIILEAVTLFLYNVQNKIQHFPSIICKVLPLWYLRLKKSSLLPYFYLIKSFQKGVAKERKVW